MRIRYGTTFSPTPIGLVVGPGQRTMRHAERFVSSLPSSATLTVHAQPNSERTLACIARERGVEVRIAESAHAAAVGVQILVLIGDSPFSKDEVRLISDNGIIVEHRDLNSGGAGKRRNGGTPLR